jgi:hypothetical protein
MIGGHNFTPLQEVYDVLESFLFFLRFEKKGFYTMCLMLDFTFKSLHLIFSFIGREERVNIVEAYDKRSLYPTLLKCYHYLH